MDDVRRVDLVWQRNYKNFRVGCAIHKRVVAQLRDQSIVNLRHTFEPLFPDAGDASLHKAKHDHHVAILVRARLNAIRQQEWIGRVTGKVVSLTPRPTLIQVPVEAPAWIKDPRQLFAMTTSGSLVP